MSDDASDKGLEGLLSECGVSPALTTSLVMAGWSLETFAACSDSISGFEAIWTELLPDYPDITLLEKSAIRAAWRRLQQTPAPVAQQSSAPQAVASEGTWNELHAPKLSASVLAELKRAFFSRLSIRSPQPGHMPIIQIACVDPFPGSKAGHPLGTLEISNVSAAHGGHSDGTSPKTCQKQNRLHCISYSGTSLLVLKLEIRTWDSMAFAACWKLVNTSYALVQAAHMGRLRAYSVKFMSLISSRLDSDLGLRHVTALEAQAADRHLWGIMHDLMVDKGWTLNDSFA